MCEISYRFCQVYREKKVDLPLIMNEVKINVDYYRDSEIKQLFLFMAGQCEISYKFRQVVFEKIVDHY